MKKTLSQSEKNICEYIIKILFSAVNGTEAPKPYDGMKWDSLLNYANKCGLDGIVANTLLELPLECLTEENVTAKLKQIASRELLIDSNIAYESEKLLNVFEKYKIKNLPLKGYFMKNEYPRTDFRSVCDLDILFDKAQIDSLKQAFASIGYEFLRYDGSQYHFKKKPYMYIEMHETLVHDDNEHYEYLINQLEKAKLRTGYNYSYEMSIEDYYLFMLIHNSNHFRTGGMGVRMMLDTYVYHMNHKDEFDYKYLNEKLKICKLEKFEKKVREIAYNWFSQKSPQIKFDDFENYIFLSAIIGRLDASVMISSHKSIIDSDKKGKKKSKISYLLKSLFPQKSKMVVLYPYLDKFPFLLPYTWCAMWFSRFFIEKNVNVKAGLENRLSYTDEDINHIKNILREVDFQDFG